jgi:hypothetical protein
MFVENFRNFERSVGPEVTAAGPKSGGKAGRLVGW